MRKKEIPLEVLKRIEAFLDEKSKMLKLDVILDERFIKKLDDGYSFTYNSYNYLKNGDINFALAGNLPIIIESESLTLYQVNTLNGFEVDDRTIVKELLESDIISLIE